MLQAEGGTRLDPPTQVAVVAMVSRRFVTPCNEGDLVWRTWGKGPAMVLLHGGTGSWTHWIRNVQHLAKTHTVWVPDMPGFGDSAAPAKGANVATLAAILAKGLAHLVQAEPVVLVGFSFGGLVAGHLAANHPELVRHLILVGAGGLGLRDGKKLPLVAWRHLKEEGERQAAHRHNLANLMIWDEAKIDDLALYIQSSNAARSRINSGPFSRGDVLLEPLSRIRAPINGIWGRHDPTAAGRLGDIEPIFRRTDPGASVCVIEQAGHWVVYERAELFNSTLEQVAARRR